MAQEMHGYANPVDGVVSAGQANISSSGTTLQVDQQSNRAVIDWRGFDIAPNERTEFRQPDSNSIALNRVHSNSASRIDGQLSANGNLVIINQNGVVFGASANVDVNGIVATTSDITNENFMRGGKLEFTIPGKPDAAVVNEGRITAKEAGLVGLVAPRVENHGVITARLGRAQLASGDTATVDFYGDGLLEVAVSDDVSKQFVSNTGELAADGGLVAMTAATGKNIVDSVITANGTVHAKSVGKKTGKIQIAGAPAKTDIWIGGILDASGLNTEQQGGAIHVLGKRIAVVNPARLDVSGNLGAGEILLGGDYHGGAIAGISGIASRLFVDKGVVLDAHSDAGNGGRIINWSEHGTVFYGNGDVSGAGNGGFIEVSGKDWLDFKGTVDARGRTGMDGTLLLDPADITISNAADTDISAATPFQNNASTGASNLSVATLVAALNGAANIIISSAAGTGGVGDITFVDAVAWNSVRTLTVNASNNIIVNNTITNSGTGAITLNANVASTGDITVNNNISTGGAITMLANRDVTIAAGATLTTGAASTLSLSAANGVVAGTGNLTINGNISAGSGAFTLVSGINGTRPSLIWNGNITAQGGQFGAVNITGFNDITMSAGLASNSTIVVTTQRDLILNAGASVTTTGANAITLTALRDLSTAVGSTITSGATAAITLRAANGVIGGTGNLNLAGTISAGTGIFTLTSGINGTRPSLAWGSNITAQSTFGAINFTGFLNMTMTAGMSSNSTVTITTQQDFIMNSGGSITATGANAITILALRDLTMNAGSTITGGATGAISLRAANAAIAGTGNLNLAGTISAGSGAFTLLSGINGTRPSYVWNGSITAQSTFGAINFTGFQNFTMSTAMASIGSVTITAQQDLIMNSGGSISTTGANAIALVALRDFTLNAGATITGGPTGAMSLSAANGVIAGIGNLTITGNISAGSGAFTLISGINGTRPNFTWGTNITAQSTYGAISVTGFQDVIIANSITSNGSITFIAQRDLTLNATRTITTGAAGALTLQAANALIAGTGNLTISGNISAGSGAFTLTSGINGTRPNLTWNGNITRQSTFGAIAITGFQNITMSSSMTGSGAITITAQQDLFLNSGTNISTTGANAIALVALRDLTAAVGSTITAGPTGALSLSAANGVFAGTGVLSILGNISAGTGALTWISGINGSRPNVTWGANITSQSVYGAISLSGFQDVTVSNNITSNGAISIVVTRNLTVNATRTITTGAAGALTLQAAGGVIGSTGNLTLSGNLSVGTGGLTLTSGINGARPSLNWNGTITSQTTFGAINITGFQDMTMSAAMASTGAITITTQQDFIMNSGGTMSTTGASAILITALRDLTMNAGSTVTGGATGAITLRAANNVITGTGNLNLGGTISAGNGALTLLSGINGTRPSWTITSSNLVMSAATFGTVSITGLQNVTVNRDIVSSGSVTIITQADLTLNAANSIATSATGALSLQAANSLTTGTGNLTLGGNISVGSGTLTLLSGANGTRPSWTATTTNFTQLSGTVGTVSITGFQDLTINQNITGSGAVTLLANQNLTLGTGFTVAAGGAGALSVRAANGTFSNTGNLILNGNLAVGTGGITLLSGIVTGNRPNWTATTTSLVTGATVGAINLQGFANLTLSRALTTTSTVSISNNTLTILGNNLTSNGAITFSNAVQIAEAASASITASNATITFSSTVDGTSGGVAENLSVNSGTSPTVFTGLVGNTTALGNLGVTADNVTLSANLRGTGTLTLQPFTAGRIIVLGGAQADTLTTNGFNISSAEALRILSNWGSVVIGNTSSGDLTNSYANWVNPITFISGNDFVNSVAITASAASTVLVRAVRDVVLNQRITTANTTANAITVVAGRNFNNAFGANALVTGAGGRWLVYSTDPTGTVGEQLLSNAFNRYSCTYGGSCPTLAAGNGLLYTFTPLVDVTISGQTYTYGDAVIAPTGYVLSTSNYLNALDTAQGTVTGTGIFQTSYVQGNHAGSTYSITDNGSTFVSNLGYGFNFISPTGTVLQRNITVQANNQSQVYGFGSLGTTGFTVSTGTLYNTDTISSVTLGTNATVSGAGQYVYSATPWSISANSAVFGTGLAADYNISYANASTGLTISKRALTISASGINKVYDALTSAAVNLSDNHLGTDALTLGYTSASYLDKNVANGKTVNVSGITLGGLDSGNYTFNTAAVTAADITPKALTISASGINKVYDALTGATVNLSDNHLGTDALTLGYTSASYLDKNVANGKTVNVSGITLGGLDSGNYTFNTTAVTAADITPKALTISASGINKVYDALTGATVNLSDNHLGTDALTLGYTSASYLDKNVANGKTVNVSGITLGGLDSGNYTFNTTAVTAADITPKALTISASGINKVYDALTGATVNLSDNHLGTDALTLGYTSASYLNKNVANGKTVNVSGITLGGLDSGNYTFNTTAVTAADITPKALTISASGINKVYDALTGATVNLSDNHLGTDALTLGYTSASYLDKNVANGKTVNVSGITLGGLDSGNYTFNTTAVTAADITPKALTISASGIDKTYDGTTTASVTLSDNRITSDNLALSYASANFADREVGNSKTITVTGLGITGGDSNNYTANSSAFAFANILAASTPPVTPPVTPPEDIQNILRTPVIPEISTRINVPNLQIIATVSSALIPNTVQKTSYAPPVNFNKDVPDLFIYYDRLLDFKFQISKLETPWE